MGTIIIFNRNYDLTSLVHTSPIPIGAAVSAFPDRTDAAIKAPIAAIGKLLNRVILQGDDHFAGLIHIPELRAAVHIPPRRGAVIAKGVQKIKRQRDDHSAGLVHGAVLHDPVLVRLSHDRKAIGENGSWSG